MNVQYLNDAGVHGVFGVIRDGLDALDTEDKRIVLELLIDEVLVPLSQDDFFGTEGWKHLFGLEN